jgi:hypothetical protein
MGRPTSRQKRDQTNRKKAGEENRKSPITGVRTHYSGHYCGASVRILGHLLAAMKRLLERRYCFVLSVVVMGLLLSGPVVYGQDKATDPQVVSGTVVETMNAASYTYVQVDTGKEKLWAAAPQFPVKVGDKVSFSKAMPMEKFQSKALNRTFDVVYFVAKIDAPGAAQPLATGQTPNAAPNDDVHAPLRRAPAAKSPAAAVDFSGLKKADGGMTVAEVYQQKGKLEKKQVTFRGKVMKYNPQIMNKNWAHVQDGTGTPGANDVTVTTDDIAKVGDTVLVKGTVVLNKDYGFGYKYELVVENAKVVVEHTK